MWVRSECLAAKRASPLETHAQSQERPVLHHVVFVLAGPRPLFMIYAQGTVSQYARIRDTIPNSEIKAVGSQHIPGKFAADVKPPLRPNLMSTSWCQHLAPAKTSTAV